MIRWLVLFVVTLVGLAWAQDKPPVGRWQVSISGASSYQFIWEVRVGDKTGQWRVRATQLSTGVSAHQAQTGESTDYTVLNQTGPGTFTYFASADQDRNAPGAWKQTGEGTFSPNKISGHFVHQGSAGSYAYQFEGVPADGPGQPRFKIGKVNLPTDPSIKSLEAEVKKLSQQLLEVERKILPEVRELVKINDFCRQKSLQLEELDLSIQAACQRLRLMRQSKSRPPLALELAVTDKLSRQRHERTQVILELAETSTSEAAVTKRHDQLVKLSQGLRIKQIETAEELIRRSQAHGVLEIKVSADDKVIFRARSGISEQVKAVLDDSELELQAERMLQIQHVAFDQFKKLRQTAIEAHSRLPVAIMDNAWRQTFIDLEFYAFDILAAHAKGGPVAALFETLWKAGEKLASDYVAEKLKSSTPDPGSLEGQINRAEQSASLKDLKNPANLTRMGIERIVKESGGRRLKNLVKQAILPWAQESLLIDEERMVSKLAGGRVEAALKKVGLNLASERYLRAAGERLTQLAKPASAYSFKKDFLKNVGKDLIKLELKDCSNKMEVEAWADYFYKEQLTKEAYLQYREASAAFLEVDDRLQARLSDRAAEARSWNGSAGMTTLQDDSFSDPAQLVVSLTLLANAPAYNAAGHCHTLGMKIAFNPESKLRLVGQLPEIPESQHRLASLNKDGIFRIGLELAARR